MRARIDRLGLLRVGPACYSQGELDATVAGADLELGHLGADSFLGGDMRLDLAAEPRNLLELASRGDGEAPPAHVERPFRRYRRGSGCAPCSIGDATSNSATRRCFLTASAFAQACSGRPGPSGAPMPAC